MRAAASYLCERTSRRPMRSAGRVEIRKSSQVRRGVGADFLVDSVEYGRLPVGAFLRETCPDGQIPAGKIVCRESRFAAATSPCMVNEPCGSTLPAPHMHLLFRTPSFRGQACETHNSLPAFFFAHELRKKRHKSAQTPNLIRLILNNKVQIRHVPPNASKYLKGQTSCEFQKSFSYWRPARALRPAVKTRANRRCLAAVPARWARPSLAPIRLWGLQSVPPATCFTVKHRETATNVIFGARVASTVIAHHAVAGSKPCGGVLRFQNTKTKDVPCSTRS